MADTSPPIVERRDIWIGDVVRAWRALGAASADERRVIARTLGFEYEEREPVAPRQRTAAETAAAAAAVETPVRPRGPSPTSEPPSRAPGTSTTVPDAEALALPIGVDTPRSGSSQARLPNWALVTDTVPGDETHHLGFRPRLEPLFTPRWTRAILGALCATPVPEGPIDFPRLIEALCRRRPLSTLPRFPVWTLRRGVQLLIDENERFAFYRDDVNDLTARLESIAGRDRTESLFFEDTPIMVRGRIADERPWTAPAPGTPIVVLSDFGLTRGPRYRAERAVATWTAFALRARAAGCPLIGIVPVAPMRWPPALRRAVRLLRWDRGANASLARRIARGELT